MEERDFHVQCDSILFAIIYCITIIFFWKLFVFLEINLYLCGRIKNTNK